MLGEERNVPLAACGDGERRTIGGFKETTNGFVEMTQLEDCDRLIFKRESK